MNFEADLVECRFNTGLHSIFLIANFEEMGYSDTYLRRKGREDMISSQILQTTIDELHAITRVDFSIMDVEGNEVASTVPTDYLNPQSIVQFADSPADIFSITLVKLNSLFCHSNKALVSAFFNSSL